jgi:hypothetical protein
LRVLYEHVTVTASAAKAPAGTPVDFHASAVTPVGRVSADSADGALKGSGYVGLEICSPAGAACHNNAHCCSGDCAFPGTGSTNVCR